MAPRPEELEAAADQTRARINALLDELRQRVTPGQVLDQAIDYTRHGMPAELLRNLGREVRDNPLPLILIGAGIAWLAIATSRSLRATRQAAEEIDGAALADEAAGLDEDGFSDTRAPAVAFPVEHEPVADPELADEAGWAHLHAADSAREPR